MFELVQVADHTYYIDCPAKIGIVELGKSEVILIDSGNDKDAGRKVRKILEEKGWKLRSIFNTHSNADHIGGNKYLQGQSNCKIFAPGIEADFTNHPILEPSFLYGAYPPKELQHKFLMAQESDTQVLKEEDLPGGMKMIPLPGHFFDMVGYRTPDDVVFLADSLSSEETLKKYQISFIYDITAYLNSLEKIKEMKAKIFVPSHAEVTEDIAYLAQKNIEKVYDIADEIRQICREPQIFEHILQALFQKYKLVMSFEQYVLVGSTIRSYLSWLKNNGQIETVFEDGLLLWKNGISPK